MTGQGEQEAVAAITQDRSTGESFKVEEFGLFTKSTGVVPS